MTQYHQYLQMSWHAIPWIEYMPALLGFLFYTTTLFWNSVNVSYPENIPTCPEGSIVSLSNFSWSFFFFYCLDLSLQSLLKCQTLPHFKHFIVLRNQVFLLWNFLWSIACLFTLRHLQNSLFSGWLSHFSYISTFEFNYNLTHLRGI